MVDSQIEFKGMSMQSNKLESALKYAETFFVIDKEW